MLLTLLKRAVKVALHQATEEWAAECSVPDALIQDMRKKRLALAAQADARADARAALALDVEEDCSPDGMDAAPLQPALPMPSAAQMTTPCPPSESDESVLMAWVHLQRRGHVPWAEVLKLVVQAGHHLTEDALRMRYRRWREKANQGEDNGAQAV